MQNAVSTSTSSELYFGLVQKGLALPVICGLLLLAFAVWATFAKRDLPISLAIVMVFGGFLISAGIFDKLKVGKDGVEFETLKQTATDVSQLINKHNDAIEALNKGLESANKSIADLLDQQKKVVAQIQSSANNPVLGEALNQTVKKLDVNRLTLDNLILDTQSTLKSSGALNARIQNQVNTLNIK